jgi:two-component system, cell cycle sensor histidine kinase and response regulator CckA
MPDVPRQDRVPALRYVLHVTAAVGVLVTLCEAARQFVFPGAGIWESHVLTIAFATLGAGVATSVTCRRRGEFQPQLRQEADELRRAHERIKIFAQTIRSMAECVCITDLADTVTFVNEAFEKTYGFTRTEIVGQNIVLVRSDKNRDEIVRGILPSTLDGGWQGEVWNRRKDGTDFEIALSTAVVRSESGEPIALVGVSRDVTDAKRTEEALRQAQRFEGIATLAGGIAHDFNNLTQIILGHAALLLEDTPTDSAAYEGLREITGAANRAAELTQQLLAYSGQALARFRDVDFNAVIAERIRFLDTIVPRLVALRLDATPQPTAVMADAHQVQQVLTSLVSNAYEAIGERAGSIVVRTEVYSLGPQDLPAWQAAGLRLVPGRYIVLDVEDTGSGIDDETRARMLDPFYSTKFPGRGLGLAAVLGIVRGHRGGLQVRTTPGLGTTFRTAWPCDRPA